MVDGGPGLVAVAVGGAGLLWLGWRKPTWLLVIALASLAIRPELLWGGPEIGYKWGLHQSLIVFALVMNAVRYGTRRSVNWPILAFVATFGSSLALGNLHPKLTLPFLLMSLAVLALPFAFTQAMLEPALRWLVAAWIVRHGRCVVFQLAEVAVPRSLLANILRRIDDLRPRPPPLPACGPRAMIDGNPSRRGAAMIDREPLKRDPSAGRSLERRCGTKRLVPATCRPLQLRLAHSKGANSTLRTRHPADPE